MKLRRTQLISHPQFLTVNCFHKKINHRYSTKMLNMPLINYHSVLTLKSVLSSELLSFVFFLKETLPLLRLYIYCKSENDT